jgi:two-component system cell cycle response regulator
MEPFQNDIRKVSLLYVEDEPIARETLHRVISIKFPSIKTYTAENGKIGLDLFKNFSHDIVLTDIRLPVLDGIQMAHEIRALSPYTEIIILSSHNKTHYESDCGKIGIKHYLQKPIFHEGLVHAIEDSFARLTNSVR